ncbi:hypothetical protein HYFRA_00008290 [Hymenoscyphus fraxineus]|uniref:Uncharacterized protein n=1 Tax=Hymenoscyphus fraxineus TaxID=746836 RepID=A0A9N9KN79_9HELO|nr:hypothetical protein HYFRA_00008290 [Hymenoscyphus fraxineus]
MKPNHIIFAVFGLTVTGLAMPYAPVRTALPSPQNFYDSLIRPGENDTTLDRREPPKVDGEGNTVHKMCCVEMEGDHRAWKFAQQINLVEAMNRLWQSNVDITFRAKGCGVAVCNRRATVEVCNDLPREQILSPKDIAKYAQEIRGCGDGRSQALVCGQYAVKGRNGEDFSVVIRDNQCP